jgi:hypothetical protein
VLSLAQIQSRLRDVFAWADAYGYASIRDQARCCLNSLPRLAPDDATLAHMLDIWAITQD